MKICPGHYYYCFEEDVGKRGVLFATAAAVVFGPGPRPVRPRRLRRPAGLAPGQRARRTRSGLPGLCGGGRHRIRLLRTRAWRSVNEILLLPAVVIIAFIVATLMLLLCLLFMWFAFGDIVVVIIILFFLLLPLLFLSLFFLNGSYHKIMLGIKTTICLMSIVATLSFISNATLTQRCKFLIFGEREGRKFVVVGHFAKFLGGFMRSPWIRGRGGEGRGGGKVERKGRQISP